MKPFIAKFQIGKQSLTKEFINSIALAFKNRRQVRISVLKSCTRDKDKIKQITEELQKSLPVKTNFRIIGFTIILIKQ
ncbi:MAG: YhbY family RNA-binding protein [archaeon]